MFLQFPNERLFFFLSWVRWSCSLWWMKGNRLLYLGNDCFVLCFGEFLPLWEELAWCCSGEKKNLWSGCRLCFSEEVINRIVWAQKNSGDDSSCYIVGSLTCRLRILAIPRPDSWHKFSLNVMSLSWYMEFTLLWIHLMSCHFNLQVFPWGRGEGDEIRGFWIGKIPKCINLYETVRDFLNSILTLLIILVFHHNSE